MCENAAKEVLRRRKKDQKLKGAGQLEAACEDVPVAPPVEEASLCGEEFPAALEEALWAQPSQSLRRSGQRMGSRSR